MIALRRIGQTDRLVGLALALGALALYTATLLPGVGSGDTAEFQRVAPTLGVAHPTGYPLYTLLGWMWSQLPLLGTPAWRMNLFSAFAAALAIGVLYLVARALGQARAVAAGSALALAASRSFWSQATIAEVYALAALLQALLLLALLRWRAGRWPLWAAGLVLGLGLAHHRTIVLMLPGALLFVWLAARHIASITQHPSPNTQYLPPILAALAGCLLYVYLPLRAPAWINSWETFAQYVSGADALSVWLTPDPPWRVAWEHLQELALRLIWPQFLPIGLPLALLGVARLWWRDRAAAALVSAGYVLICLFCTLFFVQDVEVFLISAHLIAALLLGEGAMLLVEGQGSGIKGQGPRGEEPGSSRRLASFAGPSPAGSSSRTSPASPSAPALRSRWRSWLGWALLLVPALLLLQNLAPIRAANTGASEAVARALLGQPLPQHALLIVDWEGVEGLRYLQAIEGLRPDIEVRPLNADVARQDAAAALAAGRAAYLLRPQPGLGLAQTPEGRLWRLSDTPPALRVATPADQRWQDGITLKGYTLPRGPYQPGDIVPLTLEWQARATPQQRYTLFVHLVGADGRVWGQQDREPASAPTQLWQPSQRLVDVYGPALSLDVPPGRYQVVIGWYAYPSLARVPLASGAADTFTVGEIEVLGAR